MIYISQGHEKGIGLEIFFKSLLRLHSSECQLLSLHAHREEVSYILKLMDLPHEIKDDYLIVSDRKISFKNVNQSNHPLSTSSLESILEDINPKDIIVTLPTSKDQLLYKDVHCSGYTEFFRKSFKDNHMSMIFKGPEGFTLLLTDHIPLKQVPNALTKELILSKIKYVQKGLNQYFQSKMEFVFSGINPHAGEQGILGTEDSIIEEAIQELRKNGFKASGPFPGDTLHFHKENRRNKVFVYAFHDQGLPVFKAQNGLFGINITLGLPFLRLSVDHGTAFSLYGKNEADCSGCLYTLKEALRIHS